MVLVWEVGSNDELFRESFKNVYVSLVFLDILGFSVFFRIGLGFEKEIGIFDKSN